MVNTMAEAVAPVQPSPGVLMALEWRYNNMAPNRSHASGNGDITMPQRNQSVIGAASRIAEDPDQLKTPEAHIELMFKQW